MHDWIYWGIASSLLDNSVLFNVQGCATPLFCGFRKALRKNAEVRKDLPSNGKSFEVCDSFASVVAFCPFITICQKAVYCKVLIVDPHSLNGEEKVQPQTTCFSKKSC